MVEHDINGIMRKVRLDLLIWQRMVVKGYKMVGGET